jgi:tRNA (guanine-N7-)-methyltransferase
MGHDKLRKFAENEHFSCLLQPSAEEVLADGYFHLRDHEVKGRWNGMMFHGDPDAPLVLELGCGKGEYTIALAGKEPCANFIGVDIKGARLWKGAKYATEHALPNVAFLRTRIEFITAYFAPGEVSEIWLTFSDPQMRRENARLSSPLFLERYRKFLRKGGIVHLKTDSRFLHEYTKAVCAANGLEVLACTEDLYGGDADVPPITREVQTFYESMFLEQGYKINYLSFRIDREGDFVSPADFDADYWRSVEGPRLLFGHDSAETRRQKLHAAKAASEEEE